jgi:hypothetical protein
VRELGFSYTRNMPKSLKTWFKIHFVLDYLFAIPLFIFPNQFVSMLGLNEMSPLLARIVAAALFGIGGTSLWMNNEGKEAYMTMLRLKIIWSATAVLGMALTFTITTPLMGWIVMSTFAGFCLLWIYFLYKLS